MKTKILKTIFISIFPVLFILAGNVAKADTFTWMGLATYSLGGAGFDQCMCHSTWTLQTDKSTYAPGETVNLTYFYSDDSGNTWPETTGAKLILGGLAHPYPGTYFSENYLQSNSAWENSIFTILTNPRDNIIDFNDYSIEGVYIVNYQGVYTPDTETPPLFPNIPFYVTTTTPTNNDPLVKVR